MPPFKFHTPSTLDEAFEIVKGIKAENLDYDWIAGGTDLLPNYKWHINTKPHVISLSKIKILNKISKNHIGAMARLYDLSQSSVIHPLIAKSASLVASVMIRRSATLGGNICLDTRCFWFNQSEEWRESIDYCHKCDCGTGADCRVIPNQNTLCVATYQADLAPVLMCLGSTIHMASPEGERSVPMYDFFKLDGITKNILLEDELVTHITLPNDISDWEGDYQKLTQRDSWDFPEAGVAVSWKKGVTGPSEIRVATTGIEPIPRFHAEESQRILDTWSGENSVEELAESIRKSVKPVLNTWFQPSYRRKMVKVLSRRASKGLLEM